MLFDGTVSVQAAGAPDRLAHRGEWLLLTAAHGETGGQFAPDAYPSWRSDWLEAQDMPLKYVVARLNRYTDDKIVAEGDAVANLRVTGRFQLSRTRDALSMISALLDVDAVQNGAHVYLSPRHPHARTTVKGPTA